MRFNWGDFGLLHENKKHNDAMQFSACFYHPKRCNINHLFQTMIKFLIFTSLNYAESCVYCICTFNNSNRSMTSNFLLLNTC